MEKILKIILCLLLFATLSGKILNAADWPIFKGNIYFTGNNDEIIVKNNNLKWLFQADDRVYNPVESDGMIYFVDARGQVYCTDEEYGKLIWKVNLKQISSQFKAYSKSAGKVKYPLIKNDTLFLSDPIAIYAINKRTGAILWARTGMRQENTRPDLAGRLSAVMVDGIYADPILLDNNIFYGTRNTFISREIRNGHENWTNEQIKTYSGYPTFYDDLIFTQSMDYSSGKFTIYCLKADSGKEIWSQNIAKPVKIFPPVVYKENVYIPSENKIFCLDIKTGEKKWISEYKQLITSNPGFTDRSIIFTSDNSGITVVDPKNGNILQNIITGQQTSPLFVTVRDQVYIAYNEYNNVNDRQVSYGKLAAVNFSDNSKIWEYKTPFPGAVSQPAASGGILFLPSGNYLYAIGTEYYPRIVDGGSGHATVPDKKELDRSGNEIAPPQPIISKRPEAEKELKTRKLDITITDENKKPIPAEVEVTKRDKGRIVYHDRKRVDKTGKIDVPEGNDVELLVTSEGYIPKKEIINNDDKEKTITLERLQKGKSYDIDNLLFEVNKAYLKKESIDILDKLIRLMKENPGMKIEIRGHTDSTGEEKYNQKLSERRADSVVDYMIKNGVSPERLNSVGFGESKPVASNDTEEGRKKNRRTEIYVKEK